MSDPGSAPRDSAAAILLAFDCSGPSCSAAVARGGRVLAAAFETRPRGQGERLLPMVGEVLAEAGCGYADLAGIAVTLGPGSFTGLRIGLATARALALATGLPLVGRTSFAVLAAAAAPARVPGERLLVAIDSQRGDLFLQGFDAQASATEAPWACAAREAAARLEGPLLLAGSGAGRLAEALAAQGRSCRIAEAAQLPDAAVLARLASLAPLPPAGGPPPAALYLRPPDTTQPAPPGRGAR
ncbi:tRNA threonylcarbamoyladenosine biosynthesis protein TsaB [Tistlia consotensis]|uniref:tRNA threonylcarbamoyladenosine biosynthesis protein TsaB n=1 Tax=Tistlia consotensis USBA 355 TaxID=560819 RepID=A0A1Y6CTW9_9PROT|nr:tRNA (adenosine(37)-N6)-threonylcarbamoyltransferase complex dimerization subunit type 1 TsaB [Tistlia consotensis]SMF74391.1 tRNA threonylcarbamoyladenosine biosynthesis protein TsaB [Tistlia consotensis USBA 355]SNS10487.1 tRNA threonylcarbamoyladenosine biosynthesis protein TsaB [Tistlia consotensis]